MAWTKTSNGKIVKFNETYTLPSSATTEYTSVVNSKEIGPDYSNNNRYIACVFNASAVSGTNLDIGIYACDSDGSNPVRLKDAIVADITGAGAVVGLVDINAYPAQYYVLGWTADADESSNTIEISIFA